MTKTFDMPLNIGDISFVQKDSILSVTLSKKSASKLADLLDDPSKAIVSCKNKFNATDVSSILGISINALEDSGMIFDEQGDISREDLYKDLGL